MNLAALPQEIIQEGLFCCWRYEERNGKKTKVPYQPLTGERARSNDPSCFSDYAAASSAEGYDGIGIGIFGRICAIDLDHCFTDDGRYTNDASEIVELMLGISDTVISRRLKKAREMLKGMLEGVDLDEE